MNSVCFEALMRPLPAALRNISGVVRASRLERPPVPTVPCGIGSVDELTGGLPRGALTEIYGAASSGRTSLMMSALAMATVRQELCALIDVSDCFDPQSAQAAGVDMERLLWVRCSGDLRPASFQQQAIEHSAESGNMADVKRRLQAKQQTGTIMPGAKVWYGRSPARSERTHEITRTNYSEFQSRKSEIAAVLPSHLRNEKKYPGTTVSRWTRPVEQALKAADLLLQSGGFGVVAIDFGDVPAEIAKRVPLTSWFRFRRAVENTPTVLLAITQESCAKTCASLVLRMAGARIDEQSTSTAAPSHARVFAGLESTVEIVRSRVDDSSCDFNCKKPPRPARAEFRSLTEWTSPVTDSIVGGNGKLA